MDAAPPATAPSADAELFRCIVAGIDDTPESLVGAAQAAALRPPGSSLYLVAVAERYLAAHAGAAAAHARAAIDADTSADLDLARELVDADEAVMKAGRLVEVLIAERSRRDGTLLVIGTQPHRRIAALTFGGHDMEALHDAPGSVLVARPGWGPAPPERIVVGIDGSPESRVAEAVARSLAARLDVRLVPVVPLGAHVPASLLKEERDDAVLHPGSFVDALADSSDRGTLVVVGRQEGARRWSGSDAERVVFATRCSALVVDYDPRARGDG